MTVSSMTSEQFWALIDKARSGSQSSARPEALFTVLDSLETEDVKAFMRLYTERLCEINKWKLWAAGYVITGGMGDDSFHYFRSWVIGKGLAVYETALNHPDDLGPFIDNPEVENEALEYVALDVLEKRGEDSDPREDVGRFPDDAPDGEPFDEDDVAAIVPNLAAQFG